VQFNLRGNQAEAVRTFPTHIALSQFAVSAEGRYARKIEMLWLGGVYFARSDELAVLFKAAEKDGLCLDCRQIFELSRSKTLGSSYEWRSENGKAAGGDFGSCRKPWDYENIPASSQKFALGAAFGSVK
jgi:hypothetical protein